MKFTIEVLTKLSGRVGYLTQSENSKKFMTPLLLQTTKSGSVPYISRDVFNMLSNDQHIIEICLANTEHMEEALKHYQKGIASFAGFGDMLTLVTLKDPCEKIGNGYDATRESVPLLTRTGKKLMTVERYMDIMEVFKPTIYQVLSDADTNQDTSSKRAQKAVEKTELFFDKCLERHRKSENLKKSFLLAPIVGGYSKEARSKSIKKVSSADEVDGFIIEGLHCNGVSALDVKLEPLKEIVSDILSQLPVEKPKFMLGPYDPIVILELICLGIDVFDTSYAYIATKNFRILTFHFNIEDISDKDNEFCIDIREEKYKDDFSPLLEGCTCLACRKHTKAYVNHLFNVKELLGSILLMIHNIHHYLRFFESIQCAIAADRLPALIEIINSQKSNQKAAEIATGAEEKVDEAEKTSNEVEQTTKKTEEMAKKTKSISDDVKNQSDAVKT